MSDPEKNKGATPKRPPDSPSTSSKRLRDRVSFYEKVWTGSGSSSLDSDDVVNVDELERKLAEERARHLEHTHIEHVQLRQTPPTSPRHLVQHLQEIKPDGSIEETLIERVEEGDVASGMKTVKFEKVTVRKSVKQITSTTSSVRALSSRTPSEELLLEDSAYQTHTNGSALSHSKSSSISSLTGRFPSEESLRRTPSRENDKDDWETSSNGSGKVASSSSEWYSEYRTQSFQTHSPTKRDYFRSKSEYDHHIATIRGQLFYLIQFLFFSFNT